MADYWFTADNHFNHANIIEYCGRPWETAALMDEAMMEVWNRYVRPEDCVYVLGDFCWDINYDAVMHFQKRLHGQKIFLKGNHDHWYKRDRKYMRHKYIQLIHCWMAHYPLRTWPNGINLHGHCHGTLDTGWSSKPTITSSMANQFDVGVDTNEEYRPYHWEEIKALIKPEHLSREGRP